MSYYLYGYNDCKGYKEIIHDIDDKMINGIRKDFETRYQNNLEKVNKSNSNIDKLIYNIFLTNNCFSTLEKDYIANQILNYYSLHKYNGEFIYLEKDFYRLYTIIKKKSSGLDLLLINKDDCNEPPRKIVIVYENKVQIDDLEEQHYRFRDNEIEKDSNKKAIIVLLLVANVFALLFKLIKQGKWW